MDRREPTDSVDGRVRVRTGLSSRPKKHEGRGRENDEMEEDEGRDLKTILYREFSILYIIQYSIINVI